MESLYYIEEVASRMGLTARTLRFWEEKGLLTPVDRTEGGLRRYCDADIARAARIRDLKEVLGLPLDVIRTLLQAEDEIERLRQQAQQQSDPADRLPIVRQVIAIVEGQMQLIDERTARLLELREGYAQRLERLHTRLKELEGSAGC